MIGYITFGGDFMKKPELLVIGIDGAMPSYVKEAVSKGRLPAFKKLMI